jgi:PAS domain S-box-containing protein
MQPDDMEQRKAFLAAIIDTSEDAIISKDLSSTIISWNKSAERIFGYSAEEAVGRSIYMIIPPDRYQEEGMIISRLSRGERIEHFETIRQRKDGRLIHISLTVSPIRDENGKVVGASKIARDISRQKHDEELIRQYALRLEQINYVGKRIAAQLDVPQILQEVTDATTRLCGAAFGAFFYNQVNEKGESYQLFSLSGAPREAFEKLGMPRNTPLFRTTFHGERNVRSDDIRKDPLYGKNNPHSGMPAGHLPVVSYLAVPVLRSNGEVIGGLFFGHPEVARFTYEHEQVVSAIASLAAIALDNAKLYEEVRELNAKKDDFIGFASHELKTPLTTISGYVQLAKQLPSVSPDILDKIGRQLRRLEDMISDLLDISKIQAGKLELNFTVARLQDMVREGIDTAGTSRHRLEVMLPEEPLQVRADAVKLTRVIINLLSNAVKFSPAGSLIKVKAVSADDKITLTINDEGPGIDAAYLESIFNRFYRVPGESKPGSGLGLYIARQIVESHNGRIWAESEPGEGATFVMEMPVVK